jgi:hypothetical protein
MGQFTNGSIIICLDITTKNILPLVVKARTLNIKIRIYFSSIKSFLPGERLCTREGLNKSTAGVPIFLKEQGGSSASWQIAHPVFFIEF